MTDVDGENILKMFTIDNMLTKWHNIRVYKSKMHVNAPK